MKKQLLFGLSLCIAGASFAQNLASTTSSYVPLKINPKIANKILLYQKNQQLGGEKNSFENIVSNLNNKPKTPVKTQTRAFSSSIIGSTGYQLQTNASMCNRIVKSPDGSISATWTYSSQTSSYSDRGTGYNYFDPSSSSWGAIPSAEVENTRTGFPNIGITSAGKEVIVSHDGTQLHMSSRPAKGTGTWSDTSLSSIMDVWSRMSIGGANGQTIHVISRGGASTDANGPLTYSRSLDGGSTWDKQATIIPQIDGSSYIGFGGDQYSIDAKGDTIAIVIGGFDIDVILLKSTDNGTNWTKTIVHQFPIPLYDGASMNTDINNDGVADTLETNDASLAVLLDNQGKAHVWYGRMRVIEDVGGTGLSYFPGTDGLMYWNESMVGTEPVIIAGVQDLNGNGTIDMFVDATNNGMGYYGVALTSQPSAGIDAAGNIYLSYASIFEGIDNQGNGAVDGSSGTHLAGGKNYRHTYVTSSSDGGVTWCVGKDITNPESPLEGNYDYYEGVYGAMAKDVDGFVHLIVQQDGAPGQGLTVDASGVIIDDQAGQIADIIYNKIPVADVLCPVGINEYSKNTANVSLYPNPATTSATLTFSNSTKENVVVKIYNVTGQMVTELTNQTYNAGTHNLNVNLANYNAGIYFYSVKVGDTMFTGKMIVE